jgi:hypothetical protein
MRLAFALLLVVCGGCRTFDPKHPLVGAPPPDAQATGYSVWFNDGKWHVRMVAGGKSHRFQGSLAAAHGGVSNLTFTRADLTERIAVVGDAVQFDVDAAALDSPGFDVQIAGGCARFDLYVDGKYRPEQVRLGPRSMPAHRVPFERCP